jgi:hypothetical protein
LRLVFGEDIDIVLLVGFNDREVPGGGVAARKGRRTYAVSNSWALAESRRMVGDRPQHGHLSTSVGAESASDGRV